MCYGLKHIDLPPQIIRLTFVTFILRKLVGRGWVRLIALWILGGPVLQMGGGFTKPAVTPGLRPLGPTERETTLSARSGVAAISAFPWGTLG